MELTVEDPQDYQGQECLSPYPGDEDVLIKLEGRIRQLQAIGVEEKLPG